MQTPLGLKKLQTPPGNSYAYYYRPPLAEGQGGVWDLQAHAAPTWGRRPRTPMIVFTFVVANKTYLNSLNSSRRNLLKRP